MPYVAEQLRERVETQINSIDYFLAQHAELTTRQSQMSCVLVEIVKKAMEPATGWRYHNLHRAYGVFVAAAAEAERRFGRGNKHFGAEAWQSIADYQDDIEHIVYWVRHEDEDKRDGYLNYIVSMIAAQGMGERFRAYVADTLRLAGDCFYASIVAPYEDEAIKKNGDITPYKAFPCSA